MKPGTDIATDRLTLFGSEDPYALRPLAERRAEVARWIMEHRRQCATCMNLEVPAWDCPTHLVTTFGGRALRQLWEDQQRESRGIRPRRAKPKKKLRRGARRQRNG